ncbi:MAG: DUF255 domain-containing protein [Planctomycetaceae bacterium]|nr:DUF255 domain-containing protein [Planctomycetaceae bacterium]
MDSKRLQKTILLAGTVLGLAFQIGHVEAAVEWRTSLSQVAKESRQTKKPMLLKFTAEWCHYCHKMEESFNDPKVSELVNKNFIPIKVDADEKKKLVEELEIEGFPTTVIISPEFQPLQKITGFLKEDELLERLEIMAPPASAGRAVVKQEQPKPAETTAVATVPQNPIQQVASQWAFEQTCLVELVENARLTQGDPQFQTIYRDTQLCFVSEAHRQAFIQNPDRYWPALNGNCPILLAENKQAVPGSAKLGAIYRGQLWFFSSPEARLKFANAPQQYLLPGLEAEQ